ncbi:hypothetical protein NDU88_008358 [Pleurodeles waltl]|uniref:Uncharacterized protein n=1 Tax=Pleurodeles waltl TaxID=8319 RepID=A0AAV7QSA6_PLEWA|nr:hypothetical protein NDU88_008358 [Pleurodeles waltl]
MSGPRSGVPGLQQMGAASGLDGCRWVPGSSGEPGAATLVWSLGCPDWTSGEGQAGLGASLGRRVSARPED